MSSRFFVRPIGFAPSEISSLANEEVVSQHAEEAAFLWTMRRRAVSEPHYALQNLATLDGRVEAHLGGLRVSRDIGWKFGKANLENLGPGEVFAVSVMAFSAGDRGWMREALYAACSSPETRPGIISALGWLDFRDVSPWIGRLLQAESPVHRAVGVRASSIHRRDPGTFLTSATNDSDPVLRASALRSVGELRRHDLNEQLRTQLREDDEACRFWAAWALTLNGERDGLSALTQWFESPSSFGLRALQVGLRAMDLDESRRWISAFAKKPELDRQSLIGAGIVGDPAVIPWLIRRMESQDLSRLAGEAFTMITGVDLAYHDLDRPISPEGADEAPIEEVLDLEYESNLPLPSPVHVQQWWEKNGHEFSPNTRYLAGKPISAQSARETLVAGKQRLRAAAALQLALLRSDEVLFEVRSRGDWQQQTLASWSS
jgi:uncharacterized protein (TIGR02270 family)